MAHVRTDNATYKVVAQHQSESEICYVTHRYSVGSSFSQKQNLSFPIIFQRVVSQFKKMVKLAIHDSEYVLLHRLEIHEYHLTKSMNLRMEKTIFSQKKSLICRDFRCSYILL